jgi:hypothetical protein
MSMALQTTYTDTPPIAFPGTLGAGPRVTLPAKQAEASVSVPFGTAMAFRPSGATSDLDATLPANSTDTIMGILYRSNGYAPSWTDSNGTQGELDSVGVRPGTLIDLLCEGMIYVTCEDGCSPASRLWVRYTTAGAGKGALRASDAGGSTTMDCTKQGEWLSTATAGNLAWLKVNFTAKA